MASEARIKPLRVFSWLSIITLAAMGIVAVAMIFLPHVDARGNVAFALMLIGILANASVLFSYGGSPRVQKISQATWIAMAFACLAFCLYLVILGPPGVEKSADVVLITQMFVITFPAGIVALFAVMLYSMGFLEARAAGAVELFACWLLFFALGYLQWFRLTPALLARYRSRVAKRTLFRSRHLN